MSFLDDNSGVKRFIALLFLLQSTLLYSETQVQRVEGQPVEAPHRDTFAELMRIEEVRARYDLCIQSGVPASGLDQCLWNEYSFIPDGQTQSISIPAPDPLYREKVREGLRARAISRGFDQPADAPIETSSDFSTANASIEHLKERQDPAYKALREHLEERLRTAMYGEVQGDISEAIGAESRGNTYQYVDQSDFFRLYESQLTQNIIQNLSNYCIRTDIRRDPDTDEIIEVRYNTNDEPDTENNVQATINRNLANLSNLGEASKHWTTCLESLHSHCYPKRAEGDRYNEEASARPGQREACVTLRSIRASRQALIQSAKLRERLTTAPCEEIEPETSPSPGGEGGRIQRPNRGRMSCVTLFAQVGNTKRYDQNNKDSGLDRLATITSGDLHHNKNKFASENEELLKKFREECFEGTHIKDLEKCKQFVETNLDERKEQLAELSLRSRALQEKIKEAASDENELKKLLEEEGYDDSDEIDLLIAGIENGESIADKINEHYDLQRKSLVAKLADEIENRTIDIADTPDNNVRKLQLIEQELTSRVDSFTQLLHYNNIMASFLQVGEVGNSRFNSEIIQRELANSYYNPNRTDPGRIPATDNASGAAIYDFEQIVSAVEDNEDLSASGPSNESNVTLKVSDINKAFLRYFDFQAQTTP